MAATGRPIWLAGSTRSASRLWPFWPASSTRAGAASAGRRSSRRRWCWSSCSGTPSGRLGPRRSRRWQWPRSPPAAMARGGMYDQLAGGFARYSVDADWVVPHFEKMLYDNALLARVYAHAWRRTGSTLARRVAEETCDWLISELRTAEGGFAAALDADSEGAEGAFYVWTPAQLTAELGAEDGGYAAGVFGVTDSGHVRARRLGTAAARRPGRPRAGSPRCGRACWRPVRARPRPGRDDKVVAAWNGLAIAALADAGLLFGRPDFIAAASAAADLLVRVHLERRPARAHLLRRPGVGHGRRAGGLRLRSGWADRAGRRDAHRPVRLAGSRLAGELLETALARFSTGTGGFYDTADDGEQLIYRPSDVADGPSPSGTFAVADALLSYSALTGSARPQGRGNRGPRRACPSWPPGTRARLAQGWRPPRPCCPARWRSRSRDRRRRSGPSCTGSR